jgi:hypothetical protein
LELKAEPDLEWPTKTKIKFRPLQRYWLQENYANGGTSMVSVRYKNAVVTSPIQWLYADRDAFDTKYDILVQKGIDAEELLVWLISYGS